ncbi:hypothetical protein NPIL_74351 [Nephila pilipes]|uniref:Uncharacterized protein n=1 Tax=Nephila pilipes TaxID=299642 RepID=A0A8X6PST3_NEPPI|nr:hypothetical protein NPIL_74351 [Nephila pilipes]
MLFWGKESNAKLLGRGIGEVCVYGTLRQMEKRAPYRLVPRLEAVLDWQRIKKEVGGVRNLANGSVEGFNCIWREAYRRVVGDGVVGLRKWKLYKEDFFAFLMLVLKLRSLLHAFEYWKFLRNGWKDDIGIFLLIFRGFASY